MALKHPQPKKVWVAPALSTQGAAQPSPLLMCTAPEVSCEAFGAPQTCVAFLCQCDDSC